MPHPHLEANLQLLDRETRTLLRDAERLSAEDLTAATLCPGWSRAHVLAHLARNADALVNLVHWACTGQRREAYTSAQARDRAIEAGAVRPREEVLADLRGAATAFAEACEALRGPAGDATVTTRTGTAVTGAQVPAMRVLEVVFHHVDLGVGYGFDDVDQTWVARTLARGVRQWDARDDAPVLTLHGDSGQWQLGGGGPVVRGSDADLLLWLARGAATGLQHSEPLPTPPPWA